MMGRQVKPSYTVWRDQALRGKNLDSNPKSQLRNVFPWRGPKTILRCCFSVQEGR